MRTKVYNLIKNYHNSSHRLTEDKTSDTLRKIQSNG